jgi:hypothetical protein
VTAITRSDEEEEEKKKRGKEEEEEPKVLAYSSSTGHSTLFHGNIKAKMRTNG